MNKLMLTLVASAVLACNDDNDITSLQTEVLKYQEVSPGNTESKPISFHHFIFEAKDKDFTIRDLTDLRGGFAYDQRSGKNFEAMQESLEIDGIFSKEMKPGSYFVVVMNSDIDDPRYSYTTVHINPNEQLQIKKIFNGSSSGWYEPW